MPLEETVRDIQKNIQNDQYQSEQAISQGIVLRLLSEQGWPVWDTHAVIPEYKVPGGRVDFALCVNKKPKIFIEVKQPGKTLGADAQVFRYAYNDGVPFAIVTDGKSWHFYLPTAEGKYAERLVHILDLVGNNVEESVERLNRYLSSGEVANGNALKNARTDHEQMSNERNAHSQIPEAWGKLLEDKDKILMDVVSEKIVSLCGYAPTQEAIFAYLKSLKPEVEVRRKPSSPSATKQSQDAYPTRGTRAVSIIKVEFPDGEVICHNKAVETMIATMRKVGFAQVEFVGIETRGLPLVSREMHTSGDAMWDDVGGGFYVCTHSGTKQKIRYLTQINEKLKLGLKITRVLHA